MMDLVTCPVCSHINTGKIGNRQYYCWDCLIEFQINGKKKPKLFFVEEDGTLVELKNKN